MSRKVNYPKPPLSYQEQIEKLEGRGLLIENKEKATHLLQNLSYYRLSGYWHTMLEEPKSDHKFKENSTFEQGFKMYCFDRELRLLILNQIEKIEISLRANIIYQCSHKWETFWLSNPENFNLNKINRRTHNPLYVDAISTIEKEINRSKEAFVGNYKSKYTEELPPSWITLELCSFGSLSTVFSLLKEGKREIAKIYGLRESVLGSWIHTLVYVRNICAHHSRLWNKQLKIQPTRPRRTEKNWIENFSIIDTRSNSQSLITDRTYFVICMIQYLLQTVNPNNTFKEKLEELFQKYPTIDRFALGYTENWQEEDLWK